MPSGVLRLSCLSVMGVTVSALDQSLSLAGACCRRLKTLIVVVARFPGVHSHLSITFCLCPPAVLCPLASERGWHAREARSLVSGRGLSAVVRPTVRAAVLCRLGKVTFLQGQCWMPPRPAGLLRVRRVAVGSALQKTEDEKVPSTRYRSFSRA